MSTQSQVEQKHCPVVSNSRQRAFQRSTAIYILNPLLKLELSQQRYLRSSKNTSGERLDQSKSPRVRLQRLEKSLNQVRQKSTGSNYNARVLPVRIRPIWKTLLQGPVQDRFVPVTWSPYCQHVISVMHLICRYLSNPNPIFYIVITESEQTWSSECYYIARWSLNKDSIDLLSDHFHGSMYHKLTAQWYICWLDRMYLVVKMMVKLYILIEASVARQSSLNFNQ